MELKTLKDLDKRYECSGAALFACKEPNELKKQFTFTRDCELKQEAIKWIKKLDSNIHLFPGLNDDEKYAPGLNKANREIIAWITNFFNITEADLNG